MPLKQPALHCSSIATIALAALSIWNNLGCAPTVRASALGSSPVYLAEGPSPVRAAYRVILPPEGCAPRQPPIVFLPALATTAALYHALLLRLHACRARVLVDLPGTGASPPIAELRTDEILRALAGVLDAESPSEPVVLVGSSLGGALAVRMAAAQPERVAALVLIDAPVASFPLTREEKFLLHPALWAPLYHLGGPAAMVRLGLKRFVLGHGAAPDDGTVAGLAAGLGDHAQRETLVAYYRRFLAPEALRESRALLERLKGPVLLFWGEDDRVVPRTVGEEALHALPPGPQHRALVQPGAGHLPALEAPELVARAIDDFVGALAPVEHQPRALPARRLLAAPAPGALLYSPAREWLPLVGAQLLCSLDTRLDAGFHLGVARGGVDRRWPLESGRVAWTVGFQLHSDPINRESWSFGYLRTTLAAELVWRWGGGLHLGGTLAIDPAPEREGRVGGWLEVGYLPSVIPWVKAFVAYGRFPQGDARVFFGLEVTARLTGLMY